MKKIIIASVIVALFITTAVSQTGTDLKVFITGREATCDECGDVLGRRAWITLEGEKGALCLVNADLDHLDVDVMLGRVV